MERPSPRDHSGGPAGHSAPPPSVHTGGPTAHSAAEIVPMWGFSFVDDVVAGMPQPYGDDLPFLASQDLALLVSLTPSPMDPTALAGFGIDGAHLPIEDMQPPTLEQQHTFVAWVRERRDQGQKVGVHCTAGLGRTGTMLATWFVAEGSGADDAIALVRTLRPGSIETLEQEDAVRAYAGVLGW